MPDNRLLSDRFPRSSKYHPEWVLANASGGANSLWLTEWLTTALELRPGMRVLDLGCGRVSSSIFLHREFGARSGRPISGSVPRRTSSGFGTPASRRASFHCTRMPGRSLLPANFFDAIVCVDSFPYFGTDDLYLNYLAQFVKPDGQIGITGAGLVQEIEGPIPEHLRDWWTQDLWGLHSAAWIRRHWERTGIVDVELADTMPDGWRVWLDWHHAVAPDNATEIKAVEIDAGRYLGYIRAVGRRREGVKLEEYCWPDTTRLFPHPFPQYTKKPLLRTRSSESGVLD